MGTYQINTGLDATVGGTGWGAGQWSGTTDGALATTINEGADISNSDTTLTVTSGTTYCCNRSYINRRRIINCIKCIWFEQMILQLQEHQVVHRLRLMQMVHLFVCVWKHKFRR